MKKVKDEADFENLLQSSALGDGVHVVPIPDDCKATYAATGRGADSGAQKIYDVGMLKAGAYYGMELKFSKGSVLAAGKIRVHQHTFLEAVRAQEGIPILGVYFAFKKREEVVRVGFLTLYVGLCDYSYATLLQDSQQCPNFTQRLIEGDKGFHNVGSALEKLNRWRQVN
jgi:hypothetical protein